MLDRLNIIRSRSFTKTSTDRILVKMSARLSSDFTYFVVSIELFLSVCTHSCLTSMCLNLDLKAVFSAKAIAALLSTSLSWDEKWTWKHPLSIIFYCIYTFLSVLWIIFQLCRRFHCTKFELQSLAYSNTYRAFESDSEILD